MNLSSVPVSRSAARVVLLDPDDRLLLIRFEDDRRGARWWATPGGGLDEGESYQDAAHREIVEETGLADAELGPWIWTRQDVYTSGGVTYRQDERFFLVRAPYFDIDDRGLSDGERSVIRAFRWWTQPELAATSDELSPGNLADLLGELIRLGPPERPIAVGR